MTIDIFGVNDLFNETNNALEIILNENRIHEINWAAKINKTALVEIWEYCHMNTFLWLLL